MEFFKELILIESERSSQKEVSYVIDLVNKLYGEWKATGRRKNAVDIVTTTANKLSTIDPSIVDKIHEATKVKLATLVVRCFDIPNWKDVYERERIYKKLSRLLSVVGTLDPNTKTGGNVAEVIMTRLSAAICNKSDDNTVFVAYEPTSKSYLKYLFGSEAPETVYRMHALGLPADFDQLIKILEINHQKAIALKSKAVTLE